MSGELEDENWRLGSTTPVRGGYLREVKNLQKKGVPARQKDTQRETHTQRPTHYLNSLDFTLLTAHLPDNSQSDFLRDEKCFRATRRLV